MNNKQSVIIYSLLMFMGTATGANASVAPITFAMEPKEPQMVIDVEDNQNAIPKNKNNAELFAVDINAKFPEYEDLHKAYTKEKYYDYGYEFTWNIGQKFRPDFKAKIAAFGMSDKRLKRQGEDYFYAMIKMLPKEVYPYIGPYLHQVPNMSERILQMPGIKETKNKFPEVVAEQLKDVEDLEFLSPFLYYILMPEVWPENYRRPELAQLRPAHPKTVYDGNFYSAIKKIVVPEDYMPGRKPERIGKSDLRTINPTADTLLTSADVKAFARTIDAVEGWYDANRFQVSRITAMWANYDAQNGDKTVPGMKDMVNPCRRLVQKAKILGKERELAMLVAGEGLTLYEWAYTCDKTIKAFRLGHISSTMATALRLYRSGAYDEATDALSPQMQAWRYSTMQALSEMYAAPLSDVKEVRKNRALLTEKWRKYGYKGAGVSLALFE